MHLISFDGFIFLNSKLELIEDTVVNWYAIFCNQCQQYLDDMEKLGGPGKIVETDQVCLILQKHQRGKKKPETQIWYQSFVERDLGGLCTATMISKRDVQNIDKVIMDFIVPGTLIILD